MSIFTGWNPFIQGSIIFNQNFTLRELSPSRGSNSEAQESISDLKTFIGSEPQMQRRVTENLVLLEDMSAMQSTLFVIFTRDKVFPDLKKGMSIYHQEITKSYKLMAYYQHVDGYDFIVSQKSD